MHLGFKSLVLLVNRKPWQKLSNCWNIESYKIIFLSWVKMRLSKVFFLIDAQKTVLFFRRDDCVLSTPALRKQEHMMQIKWSKNGSAKNVNTWFHSKLYFYIQFVSSI